jgi:curli biogenesis system outer membrane secretion channel CsgG
MALAFSAGCATTSVQQATPAGAAPPASTAKREAGPSLRRQTVAVLPFSNDGVAGHERLDFLRDWLPDEIGAALASSGELRVVERRELVRVLQEQKLGSSALASKEGRLELGKMAGAQTLVFGGFAAIGDVLQLSARIVDVETGVILRSAIERGDVASARTLGEKLSQTLATNLGITVAKGTAAALADDRALAEAEFYYQGLAEERRGETDKAIESYRKALEIDPNDGEARRRLVKLLGASH